jgi:hypothetical protein
MRQLAQQHKRLRRHELAVEIWLELARRELAVAIEAFEELAIYYEHRRQEPKSAIEFTLSALEALREQPSLAAEAARFAHRLERLQRKAARLPGLLSSSETVS